MYLLILAMPQLDEFQEQSFLLDPCLEALVSPLLNKLRAESRRPGARLASKRLSRLARLVYFVTKVRGAKTVGAACSSVRTAAHADLPAPSPLLPARGCRPRSSRPPPLAQCFRPFVRAGERDLGVALLPPSLAQRVHPPALLALPARDGHVFRHRGDRLKLACPERAGG